MGIMRQYDFFFKYVLVGDIGVGKTSLLRTFTEAQYSSRVRPNDVADVEIKDVVCGSKTVRLNIWDTAGLERYRSLTESYYRNTRACLILFDVTNEASFNNVPNWIADCLRYCPAGTPIFLVGSKSKEKNRQIPSFRAEALAYEMEVPYIEVSSQENYNVSELFATVTNSILDNLKTEHREKMEQFRNANIILSKASKQNLPFDFCMKDRCPCM